VNKFIEKLLILVALAIVIFLLLSDSTMYKQNNTITIFEYHNISKLSNLGPWTVSADDFKAQMAYLSHNYKVVPLRSLLDNFKAGKPVPPDTVAITFDDGYRSNYLLAYPILKEYSIPATIFIIVKNIKNGTVGNYSALRWTDLHDMVSSGLVDIESHTYNLHETVPSGKEGKLEPAALAYIKTNNRYETQKQHFRRIESDLTKSRQIIAANLRTKPDIICWPFGMYDRNDSAVAKKVGFVYMIGKLGYCYPKNNIDNIGRVIVPGGIKLQAFKKLTDPRQVNYLQGMGLELQRANYHITNILKFCHLALIRLS
jgi:biofilm PGA synthesis lipoprotein PgaB